MQKQGISDYITPLSSGSTFYQHRAAGSLPVNLTWHCAAHLQKIQYGYLDWAYNTMDNLTLNSNEEFQGDNHSARFFALLGLLIASLWNLFQAIMQYDNENWKVFYLILTLKVVVLGNFCLSSLALTSQVSKCFENLTNICLYYTF